MRVLSVIHSPVFAGPHNQALRLDPTLSRAGVHTTVVVPDEPGDAARRLQGVGIDTVAMPLPRVRATLDPRVQLRFFAGSIPEVRALRRLIAQRQIDVVQVAGLVNPHGAVAARFAGVPVVWQILDTRAPAAVALPAMLLVRALADVVMPTGLHLLDRQPGGKALRGRAVPYIPPVDTAAFRPRPELRADVRAEWGVPTDVPVVGAVANINPQKGIEHLLRALADVRATSDARLVIVGSEHASHRRYAATVRSLVTTLGLNGTVVFTGPRADVDRQMQGFDVLALSSVPRSEGIPTAVLEAMACGVPVVATDVGAVSEAVDSGNAGIVVPPLDRHALARALEGLLSNPERAREMGAAARRRAESLFTVERCAEAHLQAYRAAVSRKRESLQPSQGS